MPCTGASRPLKTKRLESLIGLLTTQKQSAGNSIDEKYAGDIGDVGDDILRTSDEKVKCEPSSGYRMRYLTSRGQDTSKSPANMDRSWPSDAHFRTGTSSKTLLERRPAYSINVRESAFRQAISKLDNRKQEELTSVHAFDYMRDRARPEADSWDLELEDLFNELSRADEEHRSESWFRRGLGKMRPFLDGLYIGVDATSSVAGLDPIASGAFGIVKSVTSLSLGLCGASEDIEGRIRLFIECIPAINRCNNILETHPSFHTIHKALVRVYNDIIDFYFTALGILRSSNVVWALGQSEFKQCFPEVISSFATHTDQLSLAIGIETIGKIIETDRYVQKISEQQIKEYIEEHLDNGRDQEISFILDKRAEGSCRWLQYHPDFCRWQRLSPPSVNCFTMFGGMGCGKTMIASFITDHLREKFESADSNEAIVCHYYCKEDGERNDPSNIYRSLVSQLLDFRPDLKGKFMTWFDKTKPKTTPKKPTQSPERLREFLVDLIRASGQWVFIVVDALDECQRYFQQDLPRLCHELSDAPFKVFISSRPDNSLEISMPPATSYLDFKPTYEQDRLITAYLTSEYLSDMVQTAEETVVDKIARNAKGCAIWIKLVLEYLREESFHDRETLLTAIDRIPPSVAGLYAQLFNQAMKRAGSGPRAGQVLEKTLEVLAVAHRPLNLRELSCAVASGVVEGRACLSQIEHSFGYRKKVLELARPFVAAEGSADSSIVRLIHHSLKESILKDAPGNWSSTHQRVNTLDSSANLQRMHGSVARACIIYLACTDFGQDMFDPAYKLEDSASSPMAATEDSQDGDADILPLWFAMMTGNENDYWDKRAAIKRIHPFFDYAACYWGCHLSETADQDALELHDLAAIICHPGSNYLKNWLRYSRELTCTELGSTVWEQSPEVDQLVIASYFGHRLSVRRLLDCSDADLEGLSIHTALFWAAYRGYDSCLELILGKKDHINRSIYRARGSLALAAAAISGSTGCLKMLIKSDLFDINLPDQSGWSPLLYAIASDHAEAVDLLLGSPDVDLQVQSVREAGANALTIAASGAHFNILGKLLDYPLLDTDDVNAADNLGMTPLIHTIRHGNLGMVRCLLRHDASVTLVDKKKRSPIYWAAQKEDAAILRELLALDPAGANATDDDQYTVLHAALESPNSQTFAELLATQGIDVNQQDSLGSSVLWCAAKCGRIDLVQLLCKHADHLHLDLERCDAWGVSPLNGACSTTCRTAPSILKTLIAHGANLGSTDLRGCGLLASAAVSGSLENMKVLLGVPDIEIDVRNRAGQTALSLAAASLDPRTLDAMVLLLGTGVVDIDSTDEAGRTPLSYAAGSGQLEKVKLLVNSTGVRIDLSDMNGATPLDHAKRYCWKDDSSKKQVLALLNPEEHA